MTNINLNGMNEEGKKIEKEEKMDWAKVLKKGISISKKMATEVIEYSMEQQANAQRDLNNSRSRAQKLSDEELERRLRKALDEGKRDLNTATMAEEYKKRRNGK